MFAWISRIGRPASFTYPNPEAHIITIPEDVSVRSYGRTRLHIHWREKADIVTISNTFSPGQPFLSVAGKNEITILDKKTSTRPLFSLAFSGGLWHGRTLIGAERILPLQKVVNFRDIGGYRTKDGSTLRWGVLYRSGALSHLNPPDKNYLQQLGLRTICDLRSAEEMARFPDIRPSGVVYQPLPVANIAGRTRLRAIHATFLRRELLHELMLEGYTRVMVDENAQAVGQIFRLLADATHLPLLVHCAAGKDRTGIVIALLLHTLGVPDETILADYTMSNLFYRQFKALLAPDIKRLRRFGITADDLHAVLIVRPAMLQAVFTHIRQKYGAISAYLHHAAGVDAETMSAVRRNLLGDV